jgi:hypothetical protein
MIGMSHGSKVGFPSFLSDDDGRQPRSYQKQISDESTSTTIAVQEGVNALEMIMKISQALKYLPGIGFRVQVCS